MTTDVATSLLDEERWGVKTARAVIATNQDLDRVNRFCEHHGVRFLILRVSTSDSNLIREIERRGCFLTDTLLWFRRDLTQAVPPLESSEIRIRPLRADEALDVRAIAKAAFRGYTGHYHTDSRLDRDKCDDLYADWAHRGCVDPRIADAVLVAENERRTEGFALLRVRGGIEAEGTLYGVHPRARRRGIYRALVISSMMWAKDHACETMVESTQVTNQASQRLWADLGFRIDSSFYTFHRWFD